jgi:hypothetical protein
LAFDDSTAAAMNAMPLTPSTMVGNSAPSGAGFCRRRRERTPARRGFDARSRFA